jgi:NAD+ diphosphatase
MLFRGGVALDLPLARQAIDRDYLARTHPELFDELWADQTTRVLAMFDGGVLLDGQALKLLPVESVPSASYRVYLGRDAVGPVVLAVLSENAAKQLEPAAENWHNLRKTGAGLDDRDAGLFTQALAIANWHATHQHCPRCGTPTLVESGGWVRRCFKDDSEHYPRTDPAVIVAIVDENDRILLGSQGAWENNRWSILAGFVEPGESLEAAVVREMFEEAGVEVHEPNYLGSQSWPFPYSLMLGFAARAKSTDLRPDGEEIEKLRWFSRDELAAEAHELLLPNRISIARAIIELWFGGELVSASEKR